MRLRAFPAHLIGRSLRRTSSTPHSRSPGALGNSRNLILLGASLGLIASCAKVPEDRYGISRIRFHGMEEMNEQSLAKCLVTKERSRVGVTLGVETPGACGEPPFDIKPPHTTLWAWPWSRWPTLDKVALEQDQKRIGRWYRARGHHAARVVSVRSSPEVALVEDEVTSRSSCERHKKGQGCLVDLDISIEEGAPTLVQNVELRGLDGVPLDLRRDLHQAIQLRKGERFDEALYDASKASMKEAFAQKGYALAEVVGVARINRKLRQASITFSVESGPPCVFGVVEVRGNEHLPEAPIRAAAGIQKGSPYRFDDIIDAQRAIADLGSLAGVLVEPVLPEDGNVIDVRIEVTPYRPYFFALGGGLQGGELQTLTENISVPQWDAHLLGRFRHHNLFGGMRQFTVEERPRMVFQRRFPQPTTPRFGNNIRVGLDQPAFLGPRIKLITEAQHAYGPDPYDIFFRHRVDTELALERSFWGGKFYARIGLHNSIYRVPSGETRFDGSEAPANSVLTFPEQILRLDFRDDRVRPHQGAMLQLTVHEAGYFLPSSWDYIRLLPDARAYIPLPAHITIAARFALGMYFITGSDGDLDTFSQELGPRDYRLRGGGASSNRGFLPGQLGDGLEGGLRRWEASLELRVPVMTDFGVTLFGDMGDVNRGESFRFDLPQSSTGFGLRYFSILGAIRLDFAWKIPGLQVQRNDDPRIVDLRADGSPRDRGGRFVFHLTIGEAF